MSFDLNPDDEHVRTAIELLYWLLGIPVPKRESSLSGSVEKRKRLKPLLIWPEAFQTWYMVAHTGNAWEGSPVFTGVLLVLNSLACRSLRVAYFCYVSSALLYGLLYK